MKLFNEYKLSYIERDLNFFDSLCTSNIKCVCMKIRIIAWMDKSKQKATRENQNF